MLNAPTFTVTTPGDREIRVTRVFDAPHTLVFDAMTKPELLQRWLTGPPGWTFPVCEMDLRPGGASRWVRRGPHGEEMGMSGIHREINPPSASSIPSSSTRTGPAEKPSAPSSSPSATAKPT
jgi:uncharacterized protein YndB with AHSA1/START domain